MIAVNDWLWEGLYTIKQLYDHGRAGKMLEKYGQYVIDGDFIGEIAMSAMGYTFADTREYWHIESSELDVYVFFDPIMDEFYQLCRLFEEKMVIPAQQNPHRLDIQRAIMSGFCFSSYSYFYHSYDGSDHHGRCRLVLLLHPEFECMFEVPGGLLDIYDAFREQVRVLKNELGMGADTAEVSSCKEWKEAA